ncbi:MAG: translation initiation factor IF-2 [Desulfobacteraceae bacterium]|nr:translation initiation factor IF-2 [Desulfobacteraceae bacterium]
MAKVRVYELARDLSMDSKELVEKLKAGGMSVKNYMSTLDEDATAKAQDIVAGRVSEVIEEKRIKPRVIRRRKKTVKVEPERPIVEPVEEPKEAEIEVEKRAPVKMKKRAESAPAKVEEEIKKEEAPAKGVEKEVSAEPRPAEPEAEPKPKKKAKKGKKKAAEKPAKIIKRPEEGPLKGLIAKHKRREPEAKAPAAKGQVVKELPVAPEEEKKGKAVRKKRDKKRAEKKEAVPKRSVRHRKVEVFERADLYEGRKLVRKERRGAKKPKDAAKKLKQTEITVPKPIKRRIKVPEQVTVGELAKAMGIKAVEVIKILMSLGAPVSINQTIDFETASLVADEFGYELELDLFDMDGIIAEVEDKAEHLMPRPPVVTIMGHVDHGKTSLLDYIRQSNIIGGESGGITQHIGAYFVRIEGGDIVFLDTPGHEAFTAMRARGAKVTDIIVLVVAADDGVMPQTVEAVNHARAASIPIIVAINKIDKPEANIDKVTRELAELELVPEAWGGETIFGHISAKTGEGVEELLELILLQAEVLELKENPDKAARGTIIEAKLDKSRGPIATVLIKSGTLKQGDYFICGEHYGKLRAMLNHHGRRVKSAGPSIPVETYGISGVPKAGDEFIVVGDEKTAKQVIEARHAKARTAGVSRRGIVSLDDLFERIKEGEIKELNLILKADVQGSIEALSDSLHKLSTEEVKVKIIHFSTGAITETDVMLASASGAIIIGFNVRANPRVREVAAKEEVDIRYYDVIYNVIKDIQMAMAGLLEPVYRENIIGRADIKEIFHVPKVGTVAGCHVTDGHVERNANVRLLRDEVVVFDGKISSLRRFKDDVKEVQSGYECGIGLENFQDVKPGDVFEVYNLVEEQAEL